MADGSALRRPVCPRNGQPGRGVPLRTLLHQVRAPWRFAVTPDAWFHCGDPHCAVVYFDTGGTLIARDDLRTVTDHGERLLCHCFGITQHDLDTRPDLAAFVVAQTRAGNCACEVRNPSGRCCLREL
jgi:hypothetical protein